MAVKRELKRSFNLMEFESTVLSGGFVKMETTVIAAFTASSQQNNTINQTISCVQTSS
jgi:hypothetical protein